MTLRSAGHVKETCLLAPHRASCSSYAPKCPAKPPRRRVLVSLAVGPGVGDTVGPKVGATVGPKVGATVGADVGVCETDGSGVGSAEIVGTDVGKLGAGIGAGVGFEVRNCNASQGRWREVAGGGGA